MTQREEFVRLMEETFKEINAFSKNANKIRATIRKIKEASDENAEIFGLKVDWRNQSITSA